MSKRIIDYDPYTGVTTTFDYDHSNDITIIGREQDIQPALERNKALQLDEKYSRDGIKASWWHEAFIPNIVIEKFQNDFGLDIFNKNHLEAIKKKLNDPEYLYLRTTASKI